MEGERVRAGLLVAIVDRGNLQRYLRPMGVHLTWGFVIPRSLPPEKLAAITQRWPELAVYVCPSCVRLKGGPVCDLAVAKVRAKGRLSNPQPLHRFIVEQGFDEEDPDQDGFARALSAATKYPIAYLAAESYTDTYSIGLLKDGNWTGFASVSGERHDGYAVTVERGLRTVYHLDKEFEEVDKDFDELDAARRVDALARTLAAHWPHKRKEKLSDYGLCNGSTLQSWFDDGSAHKEFYSVGRGQVKWTAQGRELFAVGHKAEEPVARRKDSKNGKSWQRFEYSHGKSKKFWAIRVSGKSIHLWWGRIGTAGQKKTKVCPGSGLAWLEAEKMIRLKRKKGYRKTTKQIRD